VVLWYCSGNRDEAYFEDAMLLSSIAPMFTVMRATDLGYIGASADVLPILSLRVLWEEILKRFERLEIVGEPIRMASNFASGYDRVQVRTFLFVNLQWPDHGSAHPANDL